MCTIPYGARKKIQRLGDMSLLSSDHPLCLKGKLNPTTRGYFPLFVDFLVLPWDMAQYMSLRVFLRTPFVATICINLSLEANSQFKYFQLETTQRKKFNIYNYSFAMLMLRLILYNAYLILIFISCFSLQIQFKGSIFVQS